jgi:hypothetical protein
MEESTMSITYHHYGAVLVDMPLDRLWSDLRDSLIAPRSTLGHLDSINIALADLSSPALQIALQWGEQATLEERIDRSEGTHTLTYRASASVLEIAEYVATCTLQRVSDAPHTTYVEWTRMYRPTAQANSGRASGFVARMRAQDQAIAERFAAADDRAEALLIDYSLGGATVERWANRATKYAKAA